MNTVRKYSPHRTAKIVNYTPICNCGKRGEHSKLFDAYFCRAGNVWLENGCKDNKCMVCKARPEHPRPLERL